ncbi:IF rod domain-containing protein [Aphelenchoides fujianensis]|nr:IF rod domain-containing protein [Aphelenchoides fujianensis]
MTKVDSSMSAEQEEINRLQRSVTDCLARVNGLASRNTQLESQLDALKSRLTDDAAGQKAVLNRKDNEINELREQGDHLKQELEALKGAKADLVDQLVKYRELIGREDPPTKMRRCE